MISNDGIFRSCADQADGAALDIGKERILLRLVEAVNLIDEENRARMHLGGARGVHHYLLDLFNAAGNRRELDEGRLRGFGNDLGERGLAHARRTPEDHGSRVVALDLHTQRLAGADQVLLTDQFVQAARPHALR